MIRGTTAQFRFKLPYTKGQLQWARIQFWQPGNQSLTPIQKTLNQCGPDNDDSKELCVSLSPDETQSFLDKYKARVQLRAQATDGTVFGSRTSLVTVYPMQDDILNGGDPMLPSANTEGWVVLDGGTIATE